VAGKSGGYDAADDTALRKLSVRRSFDRSSAGYDAAAILQASARQSLLRRACAAAGTPRVILDAGAGTARASEALQRCFPNSQVMALDSAFGMLRIAGLSMTPFHRVCADAGQMPLASASVDWIISNLMLQWCDLDVVFREFHRVLAPRGELSFTTLGPRTLHELRAAWDTVDSHSHVNRFDDVHTLCAAAVRGGALHIDLRQCAGARARSQSDRRAPCDRRPFQGSHRAPQIRGDAGRL